jgi:DNA uptake protein ComE-like DNA-binding protein
LKINKPLIIGVLSILSLFTAFLILYARTTEKVDINSCSVEALIALPDIGPVLAQRIIDGRPYKDVYDLDRVKGIGPETIEAIRYKVSVKEM